MDYEPGGYWSHSLGRDLDACDRRVYYRIWGSFGGWSRDASPLSHLLYTARHSKDLKSYAGTIVHEAIQRLVERVRAQIRVPPKAVWMARFGERMRAEVAYSASRRWRSFANPKRATLILYEHLVGADLHDWQVDEAVSIAERAFSSFWDRYLPQIWEIGLDRILLIDSLDKMSFEGFDLFLSPDLVLLEGYETEIIDWKTGIGTNVDQLYAYAWYFTDYRKRKGLPEQPIVGRSIPLLAPEKELRVSIGPEELRSAEDRIRADLGKLRLLERRLEGGEEAFPKTPETGTCEWCSFRFFCDLREHVTSFSSAEDAGWFVPSSSPPPGWYLVVVPGPRPEAKVVQVSELAADSWRLETSLWRRLGDLRWMSDPDHSPRLFPLEKEDSTCP